MSGGRPRGQKAATVTPSRQFNHTVLPQPFAAWFATRGWSPREHQLELLGNVQTRSSTLLIAPTGAGKTLAGFLPSLIVLADRPKQKRGRGLHTLYVSPLKALASDISRNLAGPISEMNLSIRCETRTGDTSVAKRARQRTHPPDIMLTTPEQVALMLSHPDAPHLFRNLDTIVLDELHALAPSKRGDLLALDLARLATLAPDHVRIGLSATVAYPSELQAYLATQTNPQSTCKLSSLCIAQQGAQADIRVLEIDEEPVPWGGHSARYALHEIYNTISQHRLSLVFVNTRMQAELIFQELWRINEAGLPISLHHGSLDKKQREKVEAAMAAGKIRAVVATSTLDLGLDWGDVDLVINVGAPKGASRLLQRIGRANHRLEEPSKALLVPANRFEVLECRAALDAAIAGEQDTRITRKGAIDVLAQHIFATACAGPFAPDMLYDEVRRALPFAELSRERFDRILDFVATGGYALKGYERFARLRPTGEPGMMRLANPRLAQQYRLNAGTIVEAPMIKVRLIGQARAKDARRGNQAFAGGRVLGEVEESFIDQLSPGMTFVFAGEVLRFEGMRETEAFVSRAPNTDAMIPSYAGGKFPLSTHLAKRVRALLSSPSDWPNLPAPVEGWLKLQAERSELPGPEGLFLETFPRNNKHYLVAYPFEGRLAHQTLGMLLTRRLERAGRRPLGFVANDYGLAVWTLKPLADSDGTATLDLDDLFAEDMLGDDLESWLAESSLMKRSFRTVAVISGLIERRHPASVKSGRQVTVSTDLIYDVLRRHDPKHILLEAAWEEAASGLLDVQRLGDMLHRVTGTIRHRSLDRVSPLAVPVLLEIGREPVAQTAREDLLRDAARELISDATRRDSCYDEEDDKVGSRKNLRANRGTDERDNRASKPRTKA